ncbi:hypothetical protein DAEQUDRAFT_732813 [Daedalea quercina L-15889]|uniref:ABM domain-containing protein n=1 Tax=Daedalea quercina L-15889 TaxID=1314783 RepID=A0A165LE86_9APHY|nr:hypothetical protein DAEQUDRAFT_732813 [Daedalea quercina L-15889]
MSLPVVELVVGHLRDGVTTDHPSFIKLRDACVIGGLHKQSYGVAIEDNQTLYGIIHYETFTPDDFLSKWPSDLCDYSKEINEIMKEEPVSYYMPRDSYANLLSKGTTSAPVTEIVVVELKGEEIVGQYKKAQQTIMDALADEPSAHDPWFSVIKSKAGIWTAIIFVGWDSKEAHERWGAKNAALIQLFGDIAANVSLVHVSLTDRA